MTSLHRISAQGQEIISETHLLETYASLTYVNLFFCLIYSDIRSCNDLGTMRPGEFPVSALPTWCKLNGIDFFDVQVAEIPGKGLGLVAERDLQNDDDNVEIPTLLTVPKELVLNVEAVEEYGKEDQNFRVLLEAAGHQVAMTPLPCGSKSYWLTQP
jgi:hypothetical protein